MATPAQRKIERLYDKVSELSNALSDLEDEIGDLSALKEDSDIGDNETLTCGDWNFTKREASNAFSMLDEIGINPNRRYSLVQVEEIRLAVERILR